MKSEDLAWAAGLADGEGCISISKNRCGQQYYGYTLSLTVTQVHKPTLEKFQTLFGGPLYKQKARPGVSARTIWSWQVRGKVAAAAIVAMQPYLVCKAEQADIAICFWELPKVKQGRGRPGVDKAKAEELRLAIKQAKNYEYSEDTVYSSNSNNSDEVCPGP